MPSPASTAALLAAVAPLAAYVARTPAGNAHADKVAAALEAVADYVDATTAADFTPPPIDWEHITDRIMEHFESELPPTPLMARTAAHLARLSARADWPLAQRMAAAHITSHHLGTPDFF